MKSACENTQQRLCSFIIFMIANINKKLKICRNEGLKSASKQLKILFMKFNGYQKIVLITYAILLFYFSVLHVPFIQDSQIFYDTLFSSKIKIDINRLSLILVIVTLLTITILLLFKNSDYSINLQRISIKNILKPQVYIPFFIIVALSLVYLLGKYYTPKINTEKVVVDSVKMAVDTAVSNPTFQIEDNSSKLINCTVENALEQFYSYMKFNYPDWHIYGKPVVFENSDCSYKIRFTTMDPHLKILDEKEVIVVEISFAGVKYDTYYFRVIRGTLY